MVPQPGVRRPDDQLALLPDPQAQVDEVGVGAVGVAEPGHAVDRAGPEDSVQRVRAREIGPAISGRDFDFSHTFVPERRGHEKSLPIVAQTVFVADVETVIAGGTHDGFNGALSVTGPHPSVVQVGMADGSIRALPIGPGGTQNLQPMLTIDGGEAIP